MAVAQSNQCSSTKFGCIECGATAVAIRGTSGDMIISEKRRKHNEPTAIAMPTYSVSAIEPPISPSQLAAYKTLRLTSLQMDPQAFGSNYAREAAFSEEVWRERLESPFKRTIVASVSDTTSHGTEPSDVDDKGPGEWIGTASVVGPSGLIPSTLAPFKEAGVGSNWEMYALYGMWVHPAHRGKGVGSQLVRACLEWARTNVDVKFLKNRPGIENGGNVEKVVVLLVCIDNLAGRALYSRVGFTDLEEVPERDGEKWMLARA